MYTVLNILTHLDIKIHVKFKIIYFNSNLISRGLSLSKLVSTGLLPIIYSFRDLVCKLGIGI